MICERFKVVQFHSQLNISPFLPCKYFQLQYLHLVFSLYRLCTRTVMPTSSMICSGQHVTLGGSSSIWSSTTTWNVLCSIVVTNKGYFNYSSVRSFYSCPVSIEEKTLATCDCAIDFVRLADLSNMVKLQSLIHSPGHKDTISSEATEQQSLAYVEVINNIMFNLINHKYFLIKNTLLLYYYFATNFFVRLRN